MINIISFSQVSSDFEYKSIQTQIQELYDEYVMLVEEGSNTATDKDYLEVEDIAPLFKDREVIFHD